MKQKEFNQKFAETIRSTNESHNLLSLIKDSPKLKAERAIEVYQEDYQARLTEALKNTYRATFSLIGDDDFTILTRDYIANFPSPFLDLDDYGNHMSEFLSNHFLGKDYVFLAELADYEWNFREVFHMQQEQGLNVIELQNLLKSDSGSFVLVPSIRLLHYSFLISNLYALKDVSDDSDDEENFYYEESQFILMIKSGVLVKTHILSKNQWEIMKKFQAPTTFSNAIQNVTATVTPGEIQNLFRILGTEQILLNSNQ